MLEWKVVTGDEKLRTEIEQRAAEAWNRRADSESPKN